MLRTDQSRSSVGSSQSKRKVMQTSNTPSYQHVQSRFKEAQAARGQSLLSKEVTLAPEKKRPSVNTQLSPIKPIRQPSPPIPKKPLLARKLTRAEQDLRMKMLAKGERAAVSPSRIKHKLGLDPTPKKLNKRVSFMVMHETQRGGDTPGSKDGTPHSQRSDKKKAGSSKLAKALGNIVVEDDSDDEVGEILQPTKKMSLKKKKTSSDMPMTHLRTLTLFK